MTKIGIENIDLTQELVLNFEVSIPFEVMYFLESEPNKNITIDLAFYGRDGFKKDQKLLSQNLMAIDNYDTFKESNGTLNGKVSLPVFAYLERTATMEDLNEDLDSRDEVYVIFYLYKSIKVITEDTRLIQRYVDVLLSEMSMSNLVKKEFGRS